MKKKFHVTRAGQTLYRFTGTRRDENDITSEFSILWWCDGTKKAMNEIREVFVSLSFDQILFQHCYTVTWNNGQYENVDEISMIKALELE